LALIAADPDAEHKRQSLLSGEELHFQLNGLAGPRRKLPDRRVHELFEERARAHPDAIAAVHGDRQWTYRQLNGRANQLARALLARGLGRAGRVAVAPDQLAYIYFAAGSTGEPKGAMCEHAGMLNHLCAKIHDLRIGEGQVVAQTAPQCFDISLWQLISALLVGGRTLVVEQEAILDAERFVDKVVEGRVAVVQVVPL